MAVAIWNELPTPEKLLQKRVANGWQPTASALIDGSKILGYAACLSTKSRA